MSALGGMTYTWSGWTSVRSVAVATFIDVALASASPSMLACVGSRCWTMTKAMPELGGMAARSSMKAARPPADAPIPTIGKLDREGWDLFCFFFIRLNFCAARYVRRRWETTRFRRRPCQCLRVDPARHAAPRTLVHPEVQL